MNFISITLLLTVNLNNEFSFQNENFKLIINQDTNGPKFEGVRIDTNGLMLGKYFYKKKMFSNYNFEYKSVSIALNDLDPLSLYRLEMFLIHNDNLKNIDVGSSFEVQRCSRQNIYTIVNGKVENHIIDTNYCKNKCYNIDIYLLDELEYIVNNIIPEKHKEFRLPSYNFPCRD